MKKVIALLLTLALCLALVPAAAFAEGEGKTPYKYVSLGASNTLGYGLHGFWPLPLYDDPHEGVFKDPEDGSLSLARDGYFTSGYYYYSEEAYPVLIKNALQDRLGEDYDVTLKQCALNSMRAYDLLTMLDDDWPTDGYYEWRLGTGEEGWKYDIERARQQTISVEGWDDIVIDKPVTDLRAEIREAVCTADFITYDLGINDFGSYLSGYLSGNPLMDADFRNLTGDFLDLFLNAKYKIEGFLSGITGGASLTALSDHLLYAYIGFVKSFDGAMKYIYKNNPDVDIAVCSIGNTFEGMTVTFNGLRLPLGDLMGMMIDLANNYTAVLSPYHGKYCYVDCSTNGHVEYFRDKMLQWDEKDPDSLHPCIVDAFSGYDWHFITPWITDVSIQDYGGNLYSSYNGSYSLMKDKTYALDYKGATWDVLWPEDKGTPDYETLKKRSDDAQYYLLAYFCKKALEDPNMRIKSVSDLSRDLITPLTNMLFYGYRGVFGADGLGLWTNLSMDSIYALEREWVDDLFSDPAVKAAAFKYIYSDFAACFFAHPSAEGHVDQAKLILNAYDQNINGPKAMFRHVIESIKADFENLFEDIRNIPNAIKTFFLKFFDMLIFWR